MPKYRKQRRGEVVCTCRAYPFPHRMMGGRCRGHAFVEEFFDDNRWGECRNCNCYNMDLECDVVNGGEATHNAQCLTEYLDYHEVPVPSRLQTGTRKRKHWS